MLSREQQELQVSITITITGHFIFCDLIMVILGLMSQPATWSRFKKKKKKVLWLALCHAYNLLCVMCVFLDFFFFKQLVFLLLCQFTKVKQTNLSDVSVINWIHSGSIPWLEQKANMFLKHNHGLCYLHLLTFRQQWLWGVPAIRLSNHYISTKTRGNSALLILWPDFGSVSSRSLLLLLLLFSIITVNSIQFKYLYLSPRDN